MVSTLLIRRLSNHLVNQNPTSSHFWRGVAPANLTRTMNPIRSRYGTSLTGRTIQSASASGQNNFEFEGAYRRSNRRVESGGKNGSCFYWRIAGRTSGTSNDGSRLGPRDFLDAWPSTCLAVLLTRWRRLAGVRASSVKRNNSRRCVGFHTRNASSAPRVFSSSRRISEGTLT